MAGTYVPTPIYQLNSPHCTKPADNGTCGGDDCAVACIIEAIDFATYGKLHVNQKEVRALSSVPNAGGLSLQDIADAVKGFAGRYKNRGFETPVVKVHDNGRWADLVDIVRNQKGRWVIAFQNNKEWNRIVRINDKRKLSGDLEFNGTHAICLRNILWDKETSANTSTIQVWNSLYDGRRDQPSNIRVVKGPQRVPLGWVKTALEERTGKPETVDFVVVSRAAKISDPEPDTDPCARADDPIYYMTGKATEGAI